MENIGFRPLETRINSKWDACVLVQYPKWGCLGEGSGSRTVLKSKTANTVKNISNSSKTIEIKKKKQLEQDRKERKSMRQAIRVMNSHLGNLKEIVVSSAWRDRSILLLSVLPHSSANYQNLMESVCREEIRENKTCEVFHSGLVTEAVHKSNDEDRDKSM